MEHDVNAITEIMRNMIKILDIGKPGFFFFLSDFLACLRYFILRTS